MRELPAQQREREKGSGPSGGPKKKEHLLSVLAELRIIPLNKNLIVEVQRHLAQLFVLRMQSSKLRGDDVGGPRDAHGHSFACTATRRTRESAAESLLSRLQSRKQRSKQKAYSQH